MPLRTLFSFYILDFRSGNRKNYAIFAIPSNVLADEQIKRLALADLAHVLIAILQVLHQFLVYGEGQLVLLLIIPPRRKFLSIVGVDLATTQRLYNHIQAREYLYYGNDKSTATELYTTSSAVIHLIDKPLSYSTGN